MQLTDEEWNVLFTSLEHTRRAFENYSDYPSYEFKLQRIRMVDNLTDKLRKLWTNRNEGIIQ